MQGIFDCCANLFCKIHLLSINRLFTKVVFTYVYNRANYRRRR